MSAVVLSVPLDERSRLADHEILARIGLALSAELDLERLVQTLTDEATRAVGAQFGAFFYNVTDAEGESYSLYTISGVPREAFSRFPMPRNTEVFAPTFAGEGTVRSDDIRADPRYGKNPPYHGMPEGHLPVVSYLATSVRARDGEVLGGLFFGHGEAGRFSEREAHVLERISGHAALAFENARLVQRLRFQQAAQERRAAALAVVADVGVLLTRSGDPEDDGVFLESVRVMERLPGVRTAAIWVLREDGLVKIAGSEGTFREDLATLESLTEVARDGAAVRFERRSTDNGSRRELEVTHFAGVPLVGRDTVRGVVALESSARLNSDVLSNLRPLGSLLALALERRAEAKRQARSEIKHRLVVEAANEGIWIWDLRDNSVEWNDRLLEIVGSTRESWQGTFEGWYERLHPDDRPRVKEALEAHLAGLAPYDLTRLRFRRADGTYLICRTRGLAQRDSAGKPIRMAGNFADITEQVRAEESLASSELRYRQVLDSVGDLVFVKSRDGVTYANRATISYFGRSAEELPAGIFGQPFGKERFPSHGESSLLDRDVLEGGHTVEAVAEPSRRFDGALRHFHVLKSPVRDASGAITELVGVARDITERKQRDDDERVLAESSAVLASSIDFETTLRHVATVVVPRLADWFAIDVLEADGSVRRLMMHHPDPDMIVLAHQLERDYPVPADRHGGVPNVVRTGKTEFMHEISEEFIRTLAHSPEHLAGIRRLGLRSYMVVPLRLHERTLGALTLVSAESGRLYDQAAVERAEQLANRVAVAIENARLVQQLREALEARDRALAQMSGFNAQLEKRVKERTRELEDALAELESFSYTVSHDLRAPIRHMSGFVDLLSGHAASALDEKGQRWLRTIGDASRQMGVLIDALLAFSRLGRAELARTPVALDSVVAAVMNDVAPDLEGRSIQFEVSPLPVVMGDVTMLRIVFTNLISNAIKYTRGQPSARIWISSTPEGEMAKISVRDDGAGFDPQYAHKLFGVFQRLHTDPTYEGTGIGLATVRRIIARHGGHASASGSLGEGATFSVTLALAGEGTR